MTPAALVGVVIGAKMLVVVIDIAKAKMMTGSELDPSVSMIIQGGKCAEFGGSVYIYDESRFLLTAVNLPTVTGVLDVSSFRLVFKRLDCHAARNDRQS